MRRSSHKGLTLIEALISLQLLAIAVLGLHAQLLTAVRANARASRLTAATALAQDKIEVLRNTAFGNVALADGSAEHIGAYTRTTLVAPGPTATTREVTVTVAWRTQDGNQSIHLDTLLGR